MTRRPLVAATVVAAIVSFGLAVSGCRGSSRPSSSNSPDTLKVTATFKGIPVGFTRQGYPMMGNADALLTIEEFSDFLCPYCSRHVALTLPALVREYVATGRVKYAFRDLPLAFLHPTAAQGHAAARCVARQGPEFFWAMHDELFATQSAWRDLPDPATYLRTAAEKIGADVDAYDECIASGAEKLWVGKSVATGTKLHLGGTPTFRVSRSTGSKAYTYTGAYPIRTFRSWLNALARGEVPPKAQAASASRPEKLPYWASAGGLAPNSARPGFTMAGDPYRGNPHAKVVVIEFSNFACAECRRHALNTQPKADKRFVDTGKVKLVFKNLLLMEYEHGLAAAAAAECAGDQGRFWQMHGLLFAKRAEWAVERPDPKLERLAAELDLDRDDFASCLGSREASERVLEDLFDAASFTKTAPTFVFLVGGQGAAFRGAPTAARFLELLQDELSQTR
jgi:protein-disulfide isomerase